MDMDRGVLGFIMKSSRKHYWRVSDYMDFDDLLQDGCLHFYRLRQRYPDVKDRAHMMALFRRTFLNHLTDLANRRTRSASNGAVPIDDILQQQAEQSDRRVFRHTESEFASTEEMQTAEMLASAPTQVRKVLDLLDQETGPKRLFGTYRLRGDGTRETTSERFTRLLGAEPSVLDELRLFLRA